MTAPESPPASSGPLARYHRALPRLAVLLRGAGLPVGPDRWQNVYDLLLALNARGRLPERAADLKPLLAPLLCRSAQEQHRLEELFGRWLADLTPELRGLEEARAIAPTPPPQPLPLPRLRWWLLGLALLLVVITGGVYRVHVEHEPPPIAETPRAPEPPSLPLRPVPPRTPLEQPTLDPIHRARLQTLGDLLVLLPGFLALGWLLVRWLTWKAVLERRQGEPDDPLADVGLDTRDDDLLDTPDLRQALKRLHIPVAIPTRRLDADATVARTARHAGLFQPVLRDRRSVPELVVLIDQRHAGDQMAGLAGQLVDRLRQAGLDLHRYHYRDSPRRLIGRDGRWRRLAEVAGLHPGARLLLIGEPAALIDRFSGEPLPWLRALAPWPGRGLLVTRRPPERWRLALAEVGFVVAELDSAGIRTLALRLSDGVGVPDPPPAGLTVPLPSRLQDTPRWSQPIGPPRSEQAALLATIDDYLAADGSRLLTAMAVYPQLHWGLTRLLDQRLSSGADPFSRERRLLKVARLSWSRTGWLPDWLRAALLERLDRNAERALRKLYRELLTPRTETHGERTALPVALPRTVGPWSALRCWVRQRGWRLDRWLTASRTLSPGHGALNDAIFADVLLGWRLRLLDFVLPRRLLRSHLGGTLHRALFTRTILAALIAAGGAWLAAGVWQEWGREAMRPRLLAIQNAAHADYGVTIWRRAETAALADALEKTLQADGFSPQIAETELALPEGAPEPLPSVNKIQWGDVADAPMAEHIAARLRYLAWGQEPEVTNQLVALAAQRGLAKPPEPRELRVLLLTPGRTGSTFRDPLVNTPTPAQIAQLMGPKQPPRKPVEPETLQGPKQIEKGSAQDGQPPPAIKPKPRPMTEERVRVTEPPPVSVENDAILRRSDEKRTANEAARKVEAAIKAEEERKRRVATLLVDCDQHFRALRLTTGTGGTAFACYRDVLVLEPGNTQALSGLKRIADTYAQWVSGAIQRGDRSKAQVFLARLQTVDPRYPKLGDLRRRLEQLDRKSRSNTATEKRKTVSTKELYQEQSKLDSEIKSQVKLLERDKRALYELKASDSKR